MAEPAVVHIEVIYALPDAVWRKSLTLPQGACVSDALQASGLAADYPELFTAAPSTGIYGVACAADHILADADRVEVYRTLRFDPKESRRRRALHRFATKKSIKGGKPSRRNVQVRA